MTNEVNAKPLADHSAEELEHLKLVAEVEKLNAENKALKHPLRRSATYGSIVIALVSFGSFLIQCQTSTLQAEKTALEAERAVSKAETERAQAVEEMKKVEEQLRQHQIRLLRNVVANLDNTLAAVKKYSSANWQQVTKLRDGNRAVEELLLLTLNIGLLPAALRDDLLALQNHYSEWLKEYTKRFPDGIARSHTKLVFVQTFPSQADRNIRRCLEDFNAGASDCRY